MATQPPLLETRQPYEFIIVLRNSPGRLVAARLCINDMQTKIIQSRRQHAGSTHRSSGLIED